MREGSRARSPLPTQKGERRHTEHSARASVAPPMSGLDLPGVACMYKYRSDGPLRMRRQERKYFVATVAMRGEVNDKIMRRVFGARRSEKGNKKREKEKIGQKYVRTVRRVINE